MGLATYTYNRSTSGGEIITHLINSSDGQGIHLDGSTGFIDIPTVPDLGTKLSFEFIIQAHNWGVGTEYIFDFGTSGRTLLYNNGNNLALEIGGASGLDLGVDVLGDGEVHHLVLAIDGTSLKVYDNANEVASKTIALPTIDDAVDGVLGARFNSSTTYCFNGTFYRARFWNKTLTAAEVTASYENATLPFADQYGSQTELVVDGTFSDTANWGETTGWAVTGGKGVATSAAGGAQLYQARTYTVGKRYRAVFEISGYSAGAIYASFGGAASLYPSGNFTANGTYTYIFVAQTASDYINFVTVGTTTLDIEYVTLHEIGCVADYDLAFANPSPSPNGQSLMVRDRASVADGTSSATGVTQVTPIEQLNAKAARIGTTAATPADGELLVSGKVGIGGAATTNLEVFATNPTLILHSTEHDDGDTNRESHLRWVGEQSGGELSTLCRIQGCHDGSADDQKGQFIFYTNDGSDGDSPTERLRIDSAGVLTSSATGGVVTLNSNGHITSKQSLDVATAGGRLTGSSNRGVLGQIKIEQTADSTDGGYILFETCASGSTTPTEKMRIDSAGLVTFAVGAKSAGNIYPSLNNLMDLGNSVSKWRTLYVASGLSGGVYEVGGVLKENLLTNSGFDVWSNSTLENVGSELSDGGDFSDAADWTVESGWAVTGGNAVASSAGSDKQIYQTVSGLTVGKLYKAVLTCSAYTSGNVAVRFNGVDGPLLTGTGTSTVVVEATTATPNLGLITRTGSSSMTCSSITLYEVTPGCIAADDDAMDGWKKGTLTDIWRQHNDGGTNTKDGSFYALKSTTSSTSQYVLQTLGADLAASAAVQRFTGRKITIGCWGKTDTASHLRLRIWDSVTGSTYSSYHTGGGAWEWLEVTATVSASATSVVPIAIFFDTSGNTAYVSQPTLCWGSAIGSGNYSKPSGEIVWFEKRATANDWGGSGVLSSTEAFNTEAQFNGKVPKGAKAVSVQLIGSCAALEKEAFTYESDGTLVGTQIFSQVADNKIASTAFQPCDSDGDFSLGQNSTFNEVRVTANAVQLR